MSGKSSDEYDYRGHLWFAKRPGIGRLMEAMAPEYQEALRGWDGKPPYLAYHMFDKAHVVMLTEQGIIPRGDGARILRAFRRMEEEGVRILTKTQATRFARQDEKIVVTIQRGEKTEQLTTDSVLVAVGRTSNVAGLDLEKAGTIRWSWHFWYLMGKSDTVNIRPKMSI